MTQETLLRQITDYANRANPYPLYAQLRETPVSRQEDGTYVVSTYREIVELLHDPRISSDERKRSQAGDERPDQPPQMFLGVVKE
jgi:cytochrome P450